MSSVIESTLSTDTLCFGPCAIMLGAARVLPAGVDAALSGWEGTAALEWFYQRGRKPAPATPTAARVAWDATALHVAFRCTEPNPRYQPLRGNPAFADSVEVLLRPSWHTEDCLRVVLASSGDVHAEWITADDTATPAAGGDTQVLRTPEGWVARISLPWALIGGQPTTSFGLNVLRHRGQSGEHVSPVGLDQTGVPAPDQCLEVLLGGDPDCVAAILPSGRLRWQVPLALCWPTPNERMAIWEMQRDLTPTTADILPRRIVLAQRWLDLLTLEELDLSAAITGSARPDHVRRQVNAALAVHDVPTACGMLDTLLCRLDTLSRHWFADESPGNLRTDAWTPLQTITHLACGDHGVLLYGMANGRTVTLRLAFPIDGGLRLWSQPAGRLRPTGWQRVTRQVIAGGVVMIADDCRVTILREPWSLRVTDAAGQEVLHFKRGDLAFRFNGAGAVLGIDVRGKLAPREMIYGFGERLDSLNQRGRVVALPPRETGSCLPLFHASRGCSLLWNTPHHLRADFGQSSPDRFRLTAHGPVLDLYVWPTPAVQTLRACAALVGTDVSAPETADAQPGTDVSCCRLAGNLPALTAALYGGLHRSARGCSAWGCDLDGCPELPDPETYLRWVQWACFTPQLRCGGVPDAYDADTARLAAFYLRLRDNLRDYRALAARDARETGLPVVRSLPLAFPAEPAVAAYHDAYLFGPDLLVAPVHAAGDRRPVTFPAGRWTDFWTGETVYGPCTREIAAPPARLPLFLRAGALLPVQLSPQFQWGEVLTDAPVAALVVTPPAKPEAASDGRFTLTPTPDGFTLSLRDCPEITHLLMYGNPIAAPDSPYVITPLPPGDQRTITVTTRKRHGAYQAQAA